MHVMKYALIPSARTLTACVLALTFIVAPTARGQEPEVIDQTIARVNRDIITRSMYKKAESRLKEELPQITPDPKKQEELLGKLQKRILASLIDDKLIAQRADELGINVEPEVNQAVIELCKQNNLELAACQEAMEKQGLSMDEIKGNFRNQLRKRSLMSQEVYGPIFEKLTEAEKKDYYAKHKDQFSMPGEMVLSEIYVSYTAETLKDAEARVRDAMAELRAGKEFCTVVKKYSDDKRASKPKCGNLPPFKDGELADDLKREVDKIKPGQFTSILKMPNAFQILKLESRVESKAKPFEDVANEISSRLAYEKSKTKIKEYFKSLREKAYIKVADGYEDNFDLEDEPIAGETEGGQ